MKRLFILGFVFLLFSVTVNADWPMFRKNVSRTGFSLETGVLDSARLRWDWNLPNMIGCMRQSSPTIGDLDGDDTCEIVVSASLGGYVYVLKDSVERITGSPDTFRYHPRLVWSYKAGGRTNSSPLLFDINGDSKLEVIFGSWDKSVYALTYTGQLLWKFTTNGLINSSPVAGDIDKDGQFEVIIGSGRENNPSDDSCLYVINSMDGSLKWKYKTGGAVLSSPAIGDINGDDTCEVIVGSKDNKLYAFNCWGDVLWTFTAGGEIWSSPALGCLDGDTLPDIVFGCYDSYVYALKGNDGSILWSHKTDGYIDYQSAGLADIDKDSKLEVVIGSFGGNALYALEGEDGAEKWELDYFGWPVPSSPAIADIDRDSGLEITMSIHDGNCYNWNADGNEQWIFGYPSGNQDCPPAIGDMDCDGAVEIVGSDIAKGKIFVLDFPLPQLAGVEEKNSNINPATAGYRFAPNPFISSTIIHYSVPEHTNTKLTIYDLTGREIKTLVNGDKQAGNYSVTLSSKGLLPGIYFAELQTYKTKTTKKLILMK